VSKFRVAGRVTASIIMLSAAQVTRAEPAPTIAPKPAWVRDTAIPAPDPANKELPLQFLLSSMQHRIGSSSSEIYIHTVAIPQTTAGLQALGNITIPWNSERAELAIHHASLRRGQQVIDLLKGQPLIVLRRENNLENSTLDGIRTVVLQAPGLQVGDMLDIAFTQRERPGTIGARPEAIVAIVEPLPYGLIERRFLIADGFKVDWKAAQALGEVRSKKAGGLTEILYSRKGYVPAKVPDNAPIRYRFPAIQLTSYASWQDVVSVMKPLFDKARKPEPGSPLLDEADAIAKAQATPEARMLAALRLTQEKVRYVALALGEGAHIPATADQTWTRKFGDCKGKVAMLLALLDRLGIAAEPMLTNGQTSELLSESLPSLYAFDHVVIKANIGGRDYLLDPTNYGQRSLDELISPNFRWGLPLIQRAQPWQIAPAPSPHPLTETQIVWDASKGFDQQVPFTATLTYRDSTASFVRALQATAPDRSAMEKYLKDAMPSIGNDVLQVTAIEADGKRGEFSVRFHGKAPMDWSRNVAGREFRFDHSVPSWRVDFKRADGPWKELPVAMNLPVWIRSTESIILPAGGSGFTLRGKPVDSMIAGTQIKRTMTLDAGRATTVADFRGLLAEITAIDARAAGSTLGRIENDFAYIVAPKTYVVSRAEVKTIIGEEASGYDGYVDRARLLMDQSDRAKAIGELDKAIKLDAARPEAPALQSINYFYSSKFKEARATLDKALAIDSENKDVLRAHAMLAWLDRDGALALRLVGRAIELDPGFHGLYSVRANLRAGMGRHDEALADIRRASELSNEAVSPVTVARLEAASGKLEAALVTIDKAEKNQDPDDGQYLVLRGDYLVQLGRPEEAKIAYRAAKDVARKFMLKQNEASNPGAVVPNSDTEFKVLLITRNYDEAEPLADRIIARQRYPSATNLAKRAWLRVMNGKYVGAISDARTALNLDPSDVEANLSLTIAYLRTGKYAEAESQTTKALVSNQANSMFLHARAIAKAQRGDQAGAARDFSSARLSQFDIMLDPAFAGLKAH